MSSTVISCGSPARPARGLELAAALAQLRRDPRRARAARRPPPRSRSAVVSPVASSRIPYSLTCSPRRTAASRSATLCAFEPVKCWSTLPNWSGSTTLRSTFMPAWVITRAPASPAEWTDSISGSSPSAAASAAGSLAVAMMSRSLTESARRRSEPATSTRSAAGCERSAPTICSAMFARARAGCAAPAPPSGDSASVLSSCSSTFGAEPRSSRICCCLGRRAQRVERVDAELVVEPPRPLGPEAGQVHHRDQPVGYLSRSFSADGMSPVSSSAWIFSSSVLPMPGAR